jgi:uncharacterized membrane protein HdeD (DUF308 family)
MALQCNIDARGKRVRLVGGITIIFVGLVVLAWAFQSDRTAAWVAGATCLAAGAFAVFEARAGWCALRAMGVRTRW